MLKSRPCSRLCTCGLWLVLAGSGLAARGLNAQMVQAQIEAASTLSPQLPPEAELQWKRFNDAARSARASGDAKAESAALLQTGELLYRTSNFVLAREDYAKAAQLARAVHDAVDEIAALSGSARCDLVQGQNRRALGLFQQALDRATSAGDKPGEARALNGIGWANSNLGNLKLAPEFHARALVLAHVLAQRQQDTGLEADILLRAGIVEAALGKRQQALDGDNRALALYQALGDRFGEASALNNLGVLYDDDAATTADKQKALETYNRALSVRREIGDRDGAAWTLTNIGNVYKTLRTRQDSLTLYSQSLALFVEVGDRGGEAAVRNNIGAAYRELGEPQKALASYQLALPIYRETGDRGGEGATLTNLGNVYYSLGDKTSAVAFYKQASPLRREVGNPAGEATTLNNIGVVSLELGENTAALASLNRALTLRRTLGDRAGEATTLINLGNADYVLQRKQSAVAHYTQAMQLYRALGDSGGEAETLNNIGFVYDSYASPAQRQKALGYLNQALPLATAVHDPIEQARICANLMLDRADAQPALAIFYGKRSINLLQQLRGNIQGLDKALEKSFLASKEDYYQKLAGLLIAQDRLPEAQQVLDLLKQQEYSDYVRGETANTLTPLALTPAEQQAEAEYRQSTSQLVALGEEWTKLRKIAARTPDQDKRYQEISAQLDAASKGLNDYYARLYVLLGKDSGANRQLADVKGDVSALKQAIAKLPHTVALYTLAGTDRVSVIVITSGATVARSYPIAKADLNRRIVALERALRDPSSDPKPASRAIYDILIAPVQADLDQAQAETLVWSLDGVLRYVPIAALYDGSQYLVTKYNTATITSASISHLGEKPDVSGLSAAAMGISGKLDEALPALPAVRGELMDVVADTQIKGANGVLPGTILLDDRFTEKAMEDQLGSPHPVLHIASHFVFRPGDASQSYLLLAGNGKDSPGFHLTVADFRDNQQLALDGIDLLTLSACETGMSGSASNGREIDGLGTTAQLKGAKAVLSSLWEVNDASTGALMSDFYKRWAEGGGKLTKVEALRAAQLDLLMGRTKSLLAGGGRSADYSHPFFWAPFVLMGNWR